VLDVFAVIPDYVFDISDEDAADLELTKAEDLHVLTVLVIPDDARKMTANLAAPITVNVTVGKAKQLILSGSDYNVRTPIFQNIRDMILREEGGSDASAV
jgi:flagellar assembly factor FliW